MFDFRDLFIFEMANNHQGRVEHGIKIIREMAAIAKAKGILAAVKIQLRDLDTFTIPGEKHMKRFRETRLTRDEFRVLVEEIRKNDLIVIATPFDEPSVDFALELDADVLKIGSPSNEDWPLIERVAYGGRGKPVIFSTGGMTMPEIDRLSRYLDGAYIDHAIMHCVSIYPTPDHHFQLNQIGALCRRYPDKVIGFSTHEDPADTLFATS